MDTAAHDHFPVRASWPWWKQLLLLGGLWTIPALLIVAQVTFGPTARPRPHSWGWELFFQLLLWEPLALATPAVFALSRRFPLETPHRVVSWGLHVAVSILFSLAYALGLTLISRWSIPDPEIFTSGQKFQAAYFRIFGFTMIFGPVLYWMLVGVGHALLYAARLREREHETNTLQLRTTQLESQLAQAQWQALKMQVQPHFLFNTLHSIAALVREQDSKGAIRMIAGLSDLLRMVLDRSETETVPLRKELEFLEKYLSIEQVRFQDRLRVRQQVAPETLDLAVPYLILQPLVENAVRHGISKRIAASRIEISASRDNGRLRLQVRDDGPGLPVDFAQAESCGVGLRNVRERLRQHYGPDHDFSVETVPDGGTAATLSLPEKAVKSETE